MHSSSSRSKATSVKAAVYYVYVRRPIRSLPTYYSEATALSSAPPFFALDKGQGFAAKQGYKYMKLQINENLSEIRHIVLKDIFI